MAEDREWLVTCRVTYTGCTAIVSAPDEETARERFHRGLFVDDPDINGASMADWSVEKIEPNE